MKYLPNNNLYIWQLKIEHYTYLLYEELLETLDFSFKTKIKVQMNTSNDILKLVPQFYFFLNKIINICMVEMDFLKKRDGSSNLMASKSFIEYLRKLGELCLDTIENRINYNFKIPHFSNVGESITFSSNCLIFQNGNNMFNIPVTNFNKHKISECFYKCAKNFEENYSP